MGVFLGAALLAPWLYWGFQALAPHGKFFQSIASQPFHRYVSRGLYVIAVLALWPWLKASGVKGPSSIGLTSPWGRGGDLWRGFGLGFVSLALVAALSVVVGARALNDQMPLGAFLNASMTALLSAIAIAALEETLFRGVLFIRLKPELGFVGALAVSSAVYSIVHFFARTPEPPVVTWNSGLATLGAMLGGFTDPQALFPGFLTLFLVGAILASLAHSTGSLYASMGLHAGWVFWIKVYGAITHPRAGASTAVWGGARIQDGWAAFAVVLICGWAVARKGARRRT